MMKNYLYLLGPVPGSYKYESSPSSRNAQSNYRDNYRSKSVHSTSYNYSRYRRHHHKRKEHSSFRMTPDIHDIHQSAVGSDGRVYLMPSVSVEGHLSLLPPSETPPPRPPLPMMDAIHGVNAHRSHRKKKKHHDAHHHRKKYRHHRQPPIQYYHQQDCVSVVCNNTCDDNTSACSSCCEDNNLNLSFGKMAGLHHQPHSNKLNDPGYCSSCNESCQNSCTSSICSCQSNFQATAVPTDKEIQPSENSILPNVGTPLAPHPLQYKPPLPPAKPSARYVKACMPVMHEHHYYTILYC